MELTLLFIALFFLALMLFVRQFISTCKKANKTDWGNGFLNTLEGMNRLFCQRYHHLSEVEIPLPESGPAILVSNHISGLDPMLLIASSPRPIRFLIAREQYERFGFKWLFKAVGCIPIDRSKQADNSMRHAIRALHNGEVLAIFPHGKIHLRSDPPARLKPGAARLAIKVECPIVPVRISGVARQGHVLTPVVVRGRALLESCNALQPADLGIEQLNSSMLQCIEKDS